MKNKKNKNNIIIINDTTNGLLIRELIRVSLPIQTDDKI